MNNKNKYLLLLIPIGLIIVFFTLIYRSDTKNNLGEVEIEIALPKDSLSLAQKDSIVTELLTLYDGKEDDSYYFIDLILKSKEDKHVEVSKSGANKFRSIFSNSFYVFEDRKIDIENFSKNYSKIANNYRSSIDVFGKIDTTGAKVFYFVKGAKLNENEVNNISLLKSKIVEYLKSNKAEKIVFCLKPAVNKVGKEPGTPGPKTSVPGGSKDSPDSNTGSSDDGSGTTITPGESSEVGISETKIIHKMSADGTENEFYFTNSNPNATFSYSISCESNCSGGGDDFTRSGTCGSFLSMDLHNEYEVIKYRTFKIIVVAKVGNRTKTSSLGGIRLKCKK